MRTKRTPRARRSARLAARGGEILEIADVATLAALRHSLHRASPPPLVASPRAPILAPLITACWSQDPASRPPMSEVVRRLVLLESEVRTGGGVAAEARDYPTSSSPYISE